MAFSQTINCSLNFVSDFLEYSQNVPFIYIFLYKILRHFFKGDNFSDVLIDFLYIKLL